MAQTKYYKIHVTNPQNLGFVERSLDKLEAARLTMRFVALELAESEATPWARISTFITIETTYRVSLMVIKRPLSQISVEAYPHT
jgi:hypothetical protein